MAAINFPSSPTIGEIFSAAGKEWEWDGTAWQLLNVETDGISKNIIDAKGDLIVGTASDTVARLGVGTNGQVLTASSGATSGLTWSTINGSSYQSASPTGPTTGQLWVDSDDNLIYVYSGSAWINAGGSGGATGGGSNKVFYENDITVTTDYTITTNKNAMSAGPVTINSGVTVTVPSGSVWSIV